MARIWVHTRFHSYHSNCRSTHAIVGSGGQHPSDELARLIATGMTLDGAGPSPHDDVTATTQLAATRKRIDDITLSKRIIPPYAVASHIEETGPAKKY